MKIPKMSDGVWTGSPKEAWEEHVGPSTSKAGWLEDSSEISDDPADVEAAWGAEIRHRCDAMDRGEMEFEDWETVRQRLASR